MLQNELTDNLPDDFFGSELTAAALEEMQIDEITSGIVQNYETSLEETAAAIRMKQRRKMISLSRQENLSKIMSELPSSGESLHVLGCNLFDAWTFVRTGIEQIGGQVDELYITTWMITHHRPFFGPGTRLYLGKFARKLLSGNLRTRNTRLGRESDAARYGDHVQRCRSFRRAFYSNRRQQEQSRLATAPNRLIYHGSSYYQRICPVRRYRHLFCPDRCDLLCRFSFCRSDQGILRRGFETQFDDHGAFRRGQNLFAGSAKTGFQGIANRWLNRSAVKNLLGIPRGSWRPLARSRPRLFGNPVRKSRKTPNVP